MQPRLLFLLWTALFSTTLSADPAFQLTILHTNDTHQMDEPQITKLNLMLEGESAERPIQVELGGLARTTAVFRELKARAVHPLLLHGGDFHHRKTGISDYDVARDASLWNLVGLDAAALGNNDLDETAAWIALLNFPVLAANFPVGAVEGLKDVVVKDYGSDRVGIVGLTTGYVSESIPLVQAAVNALKTKGINKVVVVSHQGWDDDVKLAAAVSGIDVIVGGHSHTILGAWRVVGQGNHDAYPFVTKDRDGATTLIVQAGEFGKFVGDLRVDFDADGRVTGWLGAPVAVVGRSWARIGDLPNQDGRPTKVEFRRTAEGVQVQMARGSTYVDAGPQVGLFLPVFEKLERSLAAHPELFVTDDDPDAATLRAGAPR